MTSTHASVRCSILVFTDFTDIRRFIRVALRSEYTVLVFLPFVWFFRHVNMQPPLSTSSTKRPLMWPTFLDQKHFVIAFKNASAMNFSNQSIPSTWPSGVGLRIKRSSVRIRPWPLRRVLGQGSLLPLSQGEAFTLASISYLAILVKNIYWQIRTP